MGVLFVVSCLLEKGGLLSARYAVDLNHYEEYGRRILDGQIPYTHGFYVEYPPGALLPFIAAPAISSAHPDLVFKLLMTACGLIVVAAAVAIVDGLRMSRSAQFVALGIVGVSPMLIGPVMLNRYDLWPTAAIAVGIALVLRGYDAAGWAAFGIAFAAKLLSAPALPVLAISAVRRSGVRVLRRSVGSFIATASVFFGPFVILAPHGLAYSLYSQAKRPLEFESFAASALLTADKLHLYHAHVGAGFPSSVALLGRLPDAAATLSFVAEAVAIGVVVIKYAGGDETRERLGLAFGASIAGYLAFDKVISPQYIVWLVPLVCLATGRRRMPIIGLSIAAMVLTQLDTYYGEQARYLKWQLWLLDARNIALIVLYGFFVLALGPHERVRAVDRPVASAAITDAASTG